MRTRPPAALKRRAIAVASEPCSQAIGGARLADIYVAEAAGAPMHALPRCQAIAGFGLAGDRYHAGTGTFSGRSALVDGARALSLIDTADIARCNERLGQTFAPGALRRNLVIEGLDILALRGQRLSIGEVVIRLAGRCAPCGYLSRLLAADMRAGLYRGGGMRACIEQGGELVAGAPIRLLPDRPDTAG